MAYTYRIAVKGDKIHSQVIHFTIFSDKIIEQKILDTFKDMKRSEFLEYALEHKIRCIGKE